MNDRWRTKSGDRWAPAEVTRIQRRFRHHVTTRANPNGRIRREPCTFAVKVRPVPRAGPCQLAPGLDGAEAHHVDYSRPWVVVWVCTRHHRMIEHGTLRISRRMLWDYTSLIEGVGKPASRAERRGSRPAPTRDSDVPF